MAGRNRKKKTGKINFWQIIFWILIVLGFSILFLIFYSPVIQEAKYTIQKTKVVTREKESIPVDTDFGIIIPNIDPYDEKKFLPVLKMGVAHAKGTAFPGQGKNIYLFAHSTDAFYNVGYYNAVFYLIRKLIPGDEINIFYHNKLFIYTVDFLAGEVNETLILYIS